MNRISITLGILVGLLALVSVTQTIRLGEAQSKTLAVLAKLEASQKETLKQSARTAKTAESKDDSWDGDSGSWARPAPPATTRTSAPPPQDEAAAQAHGKAAMDPARNAADLVRRAEQLSKEGKLDQAQALLQQSVKADPGNPDAWRNLAALQREMGNTAGELQTYGQWMAAQPADSQSRYLAAQAYARNGMDGDALKYLSQFEAMTGTDPKAAGQAAQLYGKLNMPQQQGEALRRVVSGAPNAIQAHQALGDYYQAQGEVPEALAEYQSALQIAPNDTKALIQMGNTYSLAGQPDMALSAFQAAVASNPNSVAALRRLADTQRVTGDLQGALTSYQQVSTLAGLTRDGINATNNIEAINRELTKPVKPTVTPKPKVAQN